MEEGFYYHDFLSKPGRIERALKAGYEFVRDEQGNKFSYPAGVLHHFTMKLPIADRIDDLAHKAKVAADVRRVTVKKANTTQDAGLTIDGDGAVEEGPQ